MEGYNTAIDILVLYFGLRGLLLWLRMQTSGELYSSPLAFPRNKGIGDCTDKEGYYKWLKPKVLIFALSTLICGGTNLILPAVSEEPNTLLSAVSIVGFAAGILYYGLAMKRGESMFFP